MKFKAITSVMIVVVAGGIVSWYFLNQQKSPTVADKEILFRVKISNVSLQNSSLVQGKQPTDFVEVKLLGQLYASPEQFTPIQGKRLSFGTTKPRIRNLPLLL